MTHDNDKQLMDLLEHDIADTAKLLDQGYDTYAICAAKLRNVLMIYKTTLPGDQYKSMMEYVMANLDEVPDLKDYAGLLNKVKSMH